MDRLGLLGLVLMSVGAVALVSSAGLIVRPLWILYLAVGTVTFTAGAALYAVYVLRLIVAMLPTEPDRPARPSSR